MTILRRLRLWVRWRRYESGLGEELESHRAELQRGLEQQGMSAADAARESRRRMGNMTLAREDARQIWIWRWLDAAVQDVRYALRTFRRHAAFSIAAIVTLALGIGANSAIYAIVDGAILRPLPYDHPDRLVHVRFHNRLTGRNSDGMAPRDFLDWRERNTVFDNLALEAGGPLTLEGSAEPEQLSAAHVTSGFFDVLRAKPLYGRTFTAGDEEPGSDHVAILSYDFWQSRFGGSPDVVGRTLTCREGRYRVIIGILPAGFSYPAGRRPTPLFVPLSFDSEDRQYGVEQSMGASALGRLRDGVTLPQAEAALTELQSALDTHHAGFDRGYAVVELAPLLDTYVSDARTWMLLLLGAVACVLLIACANVANLFIAHGAARVRELTIRGALGAGRGRIAGQLLIETMVIAAFGGAAGLVLGRLTLNLLRTSLPTSIPRAGNITLDVHVVAVMAAVVIATGLVCGIFPAFHASRLDLVDGLKRGGGHSTTGDPTRQRARYGLAWSEITLATLLLATAGLLITSFARVLTVDKGFDPSGIVSFDIRLPWIPGQSVDAASARAKTELAAILAAVRARPGLNASLNVNGGGPFEGGFMTVPFLRAGESLSSTGASPKQLVLQRISDRFFEMLHVPTRAGRALEASDSQDSERVVVVNEVAVKELWGGRNPIGDRIQIDRILYQVVGVVGDMRYVGPATDPRPQAFVPYGQSYAGSGALLVRSRTPQNLIPVVKAAVWSVDPTLPLAAIRTADEFFDRATAERRFNMELISVFALLALAIAATGVYGVLAFVMNQRTREIGIRLALGAQPASVVAALARGAGVVIVAGLVSGLAASWLLSHTIRGFLFEVQPDDPLVLGAAAATIALIAALAAWLPARRAAKLDPLTVLRAE
ncbi:MAG: ADOP family duplicated permease [Vicinamibacterales bacterium]